MNTAILSPEVRGAALKLALYMTREMLLRGRR